MIEFAYILGIVLNCLIVFALLKQRRKTRAKVAFTLFVLLITIWLVSMLIVVVGFLPEEYTIYLARSQNATTAFSAIFFVNFLYESFYKNLHRTIDIFVRSGTIFSLGIGIISLSSDKVIKSVDLNTSQSIIPNPEYGEWIVLFGLSIGYSLVISIVLLVLGKYRKDLVDDDQLNIIVITILVAASIGLLTNVILPQLTGNVSLGALGPLSMVVVTVFIAYAILRYQFLDVRILIGRIVYYSLIGSLFFLAYFMIFFFDEIMFGGSTTTGAILSGIPNAIIFAMVFVAFNNFLRKQVRSRIINPGYDPLEETDQLSRKIATQLSINDISKETLDTLSRTIRAEYQAVLVLPGEDFKKSADDLYLQEMGDAREIKFESLAALKVIWEKAGKHPIIY
ncbi:hypothetical protein GF389_01300, partial [Candidatus Dojkabacteria bacterium]|nr:hypothetical protein [Candidatus Dojkabacteria bacterium]